MIKSIVITLKGPICKCVKTDYGWNVTSDNTTLIQFTIYCKLCKLAINIPRSDVKANIIVPPKIEDEKKQVNEAKVKLSLAKVHKKNGSGEKPN